MQVTHAADHITHAIMGGAKTIEFGISNDAAFFQILSSTLYLNQRLAVAREVLCNAWDAHIRAGITNVAIQVTINDKEIVVRDFASGIAPDMMGPLYGTYGGSDKKNNGTETGGFGLGCKSPFAYGDHFEVTSWHLGTKTIYNLSKSSADKNGKPGITPIVSIPTDETGLQVRIPIGNSADSHTFEELFEQVAHNGEMNVTINGISITGLPLSGADSNWLITSESPLNNEERVLIRYGNVIYPVVCYIAFYSEMNKLIDFLDSLQPRNSYHKPYRIVFQAEPNTISVTPSRESLSMQEHTIKTITDLLQGFFNEDLSAKVTTECIPLLNRQILEAKNKRDINALMSDLKLIPGFKQYLNTQTSKNITHIYNIQDLAKQYVRRNYPKSPEFYRRDIGLRIDAAIELGIGHRGHLNQVKQQIVQRNRTKSYSYDAYAWFKKFIIRPLVRDIMSDPLMDLKRLFILDKHKGTGLQDPITYKLMAFGEYLPILRKVVVLTYSKKDAVHTIGCNQEVLKQGGPYGVWIYHSAVSLKKIQSIRDFFTKRGFILIDFTSEENWDSHKTTRFNPLKSKRISKPKVEGLPSLKGVYAKDKATRVDNCSLDNAPRVVNPLFYLQIVFSRCVRHSFVLGDFDRDTSHVIVKLFGDVCAVIRTDAQMKKMKEAGLISLNEYVVDYVCDKVVNLPSFQAYWPDCINRATDLDQEGSRNSTLEIIFDIPEVRTSLGITSTLNEHDLMVLSIWRNILDNFRSFSKFPKVQTTKKLISAMPVNPILTSIVTKAKESRFSDLLNMSVINHILKSPNAKLEGHHDRLAKLTHALLG